MASSFVSSSQSETLALGNGTDTGKCTAVVQVAGSPTWTGSLAPKKRVMGSGAGTFTTNYTKDLNNVVDNANITGSGVFIFDVTQAELSMVHTMTTSGSVTVTTAIVRN